MPQRLFSFLCIAGLLFLGGCTGSTVFVPNVKGGSKQDKPEPSVKPVKKKPVSEVESAPEKKEASAEDELDFAIAFADTTEEQLPTESEIPVPPKTDVKEKRKPERLQSFSVPGGKVRVALCQNINRIVLYSLGTVDVCAGRKPVKLSCRGRIAVASSKRKEVKNRVLLKTSLKKKHIVFLPCTLLAKSSQNYFELEEQSYRGSIILTSGKYNTFSVINYCGVEKYLRGVVPLEIGRRSEGDIEAVKAQAVAARTYTYKRIIERRNKPFDLLATIGDQVYGGVNVEHPLSNRAIMLTKDKVLAYGDNLIYAYYHSTCGGVTASIENVWNKPSAPYLRSIKDIDENGKAYCSISHCYTWRESWNTSALSSIIRRYCKKAFPKLPYFKGSISEMSVTDRSPCGRVSVCIINTSAGTFKYGGDKIRFVLRRNLAEYPILRSSCFRILNANSKQIRIKGRGYGHGVGMCQMGAIGRARAGQSFEEILCAYYTGVNIVTVNAKK